MKVSLIVSDIDGTILPAGCGQDGKRSDGLGFPMASSVLAG